MSDRDLAMSVHAKLITVEEFLKVPDPKEGHNELHHGEIVIVPPRTIGHQKTQARIQKLFDRMGTNLAVRVEMAFRPEPEHEVWLADVGCVSLERDSAALEDEYLMGSPELIVEVVSPSNTMMELYDKMTTCIESGCLSFWTVLPKSKTVSVREGTVETHYELSESISCALLKEPINVREFFK